MYRAYKYRIYPNNEQEEFLNKTFGCVRFVYNKMLADRIRIYETKSEEKRPTPARYKNEYEFLKEVDSLALCNAQLNLDKAYKNFLGIKMLDFQSLKVRRAAKIRLQHSIKMVL